MCSTQLLFDSSRQEEEINLAAQLNSFLITENEFIPQQQRETFSLDVSVKSRFFFLRYIATVLGHMTSGTQREYSSKPLKHSIVKRILVFKR